MVLFIKFAFPGKFLQTNRNVRDHDHLLTNLPICNLFFCYSLQLIFCQPCRLIFLIFFYKYLFGKSGIFIFFGNFVNFLFANFVNLYSRNIIFLLFLESPCQSRLNLQNLEANFQILLILFYC